MPSLSLGELNETITVTSRPSDIAVETRSMGVGAVIERERILELPLPARNVTNLINMAGAAVTIGASPSWGMATGVNIAVAGGQRFGVNYMLDGAEHTNRFDQTGMPMPFPDSLQEFRVSTSSQEANTGRASGASVNAVTRSGTNQFHGDLFWFGRNAKFNAIKADATRDDGLKRNQPGAAIGGPIVPNRLFFFGGYQSTVLDQLPSDTLSIVPTAQMLAGDFTAFNQCYRPAWRDADFADGFISPTRISPAARQLAARLPMPTNACGEVRWGDAIERHDKQYGHACGLPAHGEPSDLRALHGNVTRSARAVRAGFLESAEHDQQRVQRSARLDRGRQYLGGRARRWSIRSAWPTTGSA